MDLNSSKTRKDLLEVAKGYAKRGVPILVWVSLPCTGGSTWTFVNLTIPQNAPKVYEEKRKFLKLWSSFVNLSTGLDCCHVHYALEWPRGCTYWDMKRVQKWLDNHKCVKVKKPWTIATTMSHLMQQLDGLRCTGGHPHAKCTKDSENYTKRMVHLVHKAFLNHCIAKQNMRPAAISLSALKHPALFPISISKIMASSGSASSVTRGAGNFPLPLDTVSRELIIDQTNELFVKALKDPSLAEAMVIPATMDVLGTLKSGAGIIPEPAPGAPPNEIYIGNIPNYQWQELREEFPTVTWAILYNHWHRQFACPEGVAATDYDSAADSLMGRWMTLIANFIADAGMVGYGDHARRMVEASKAYDACHRAHLVCTSGSFAHALFPKARQLLDEVFSPALKRIPLPHPPRTHFIIAGDSSLAMVKRFGRTMTEKGTFESAFGRRWPRTQGSWDSVSTCPGTRVRNVDATIFELTYDPSGQNITLEGLTSSWRGPGTMSTGSEATSDSPGTTSRSG